MGSHQNGARLNKRSAEEYAEVTEVIKKHKDLIVKYNEGKSLEELENAVESLYDEVLIFQSEDEPGKEKSYVDLWEEMHSFHQKGYKFRMSGFKRLSPSSYKYIVNASNSKNHIVLRSVFHVGRGKIIRIERSKAEIHNKVSGQVTATKASSIPGFPNEEKLSETMLKSPEEVGGKLMVAEIRPAWETHEVVKLTLHRHRVLSREDVVVIKTMDGEPYAGGMYFKKYWRHCFEIPWIVLHDKDNKPRALVLLDVLSLACTVCSTKPLVDGDRSVSRKLAVNFYPWFRGKAPLSGSWIDYLPVYVWNGEGNGYSPFLRRTLSHRSNHGRTSFCEILDVYPSYPEKDLNFSITAFKDNFRQATVTVAPGVDPALVLCLGAVQAMCLGDFSIFALRAPRRLSSGNGEQ